MGIRESLNKSPAIVIGLAVLAIAAAVWVAMGQFGGGQPPRATGAYYTTDEGKSWYVDSADLIPPINHDGKEAVRVVMFSCNEKEIPGYLERYTPEAKAFMEQAKASKTNAPPANMGQAMGVIMNGKEVKKIGDAKWVKENNRAESLKITQVKCDDGQSAQMLLVNK